MTDHRLEGPGENGVPVPRDLPDQQAGTGEDPWEVAPGAPARTDPERDDERAESAEAEATAGGDEAEPSAGQDRDVADVPDTDEAGTGRQGAPQSGAVHPEHPVPDEPAD
ncbi:hypothetical protein ACFQMH_38755 [Streptomyces viridiviolaceus]|uniref:Uncharacterized protein n=1 Tax=Streptomyces viridiviolaceus TaxID=68282 RepID=A0ABW2EBX8_9ACTN|nr:hypothetical protein [Streptomyces viridiviolaceus]